MFVRKSGYAHSQPTWIGIALPRFALPLQGPAWVAGLVALICLVPSGFILWVAVQAGWPTVLALVFRPRVAELLVNTGLLVGLAVPSTVTLAVGLAWLTERTDLPGARLWAGLLVAPLAVPAFIHSYAWITLVPGLHGLPAAVFIATLAYFPFVYLPVQKQM